VPPSPGTLFRISNGFGIVRTRLVSVDKEKWRFDPPVSASGTASLYEGRVISGEYSSPMGIIRFRSQIVKVENSGHFIAKTPPASKIYDRRNEPRNSKSGPVLIEAHPSIWVNLSPYGGRFETDYAASKGERIKLTFPEQSFPIFGWVLEIYPSQIRVRFEEKLEVLI
jgi:hypothetical protein